NAGVFLEPGESATIEVTGGQWSSNGSAPHGPGGRTPATLERGCPIGALAARVGLTYEGALTCLASGVGTITASAAGPVFLGMVVGTDLSETYHSRVPTSGALTVRVTSTANSIPVVTVDELDCADLSTIRSGHVELAGRHVSVLAPVAAYNRDAWSAALSITTLDEIYEIEAELRGTTPHEGQRIRFVADPAIQNVGYMLAGNPIRMVPDLMTGNDTQRILRASLPATDIWGFAHELGHTFTMVGGTWTYMVLNLESWPNVFTLYALERLGRNQGQPNVATYCDGKSAYLASGAYATFKSDPFVQLCFLMEFTKAYGYDVWKRFYAAMNTTTNGDIGYNGSDASVWRFARDRLSAAAGTDVTPTFNAWRVPLQ
ncbi:MAG: M60 family metallopeptidase, partial [Myxococcales bacterium]|nr:M60 family metallopeptidase [Myxococcales bacterium]